MYGQNNQNWWDPGTLFSGGGGGTIGSVTLSPSFLLKKKNSKFLPLLNNSRHLCATHITLKKLLK